MDSRGVDTERLELVPCVEHELGRTADARGERSARVLQTRRADENQGEGIKERKEAEGKRGCEDSKSLLVLGRLISQIQVLFDLLKIHPALEIIVLPLYHVIRRSRVEYSTLHILMHI